MLTSKLNHNQIFRAFADPTRLRILHLLRKGELCVGDVVSVLGLPQPTVSRHFNYLKQSGLVEVRKKGLWSFYRLTDTQNKFQKKLLECLDCCFEDVPELAKDELKAKQIRKSGGCCPD